jgi:uncharacterized membrane protein YedE/YeeE
MAPFITSAAGKLLMGLSLGIVFGFVIHKSRMTRYETIVGLLRLKDFTMLRVMFSAIVVGMIGIYFFLDLGWLKLSPKPADLAANILGGLIFGAGFALAGYCPTTGLGAIAEGRYDALLGAIPGMLVGAALYAEAYSYLKGGFLKVGALGKITIPGVLGLGYPYHWILIVLVCAAIILFLYALDRRFGEVKN